MIPTLGLDLSKSSAGWALWDGKSDKARFGHRRLGNGVLTNHGLTFARVHELMNELHMICPYEAVFVEKPLDPQLMSKIQNFDTPFLLYGLAAHAHSYCEAKGIRKLQMVHQATWRKHFIGSMRIGTKKPVLKQLTMERCAQFGMPVRTDDEADAIGILDYGIEMQGITAPWRRDNILLPPLKALP